MRKLRHPIVMFVVAVLAVIGIGVGVLATQGPPKGTYVVAGCRYINASVQTYESQGSRFASEFPVQPTKTLVRSTPTMPYLLFGTSESNGRRRACLDAVVVESTRSPGWTKFAPGGLYHLARRNHWKVISQDAGPPRMTVWRIQPVGCSTTGVLPGGCTGYLAATNGPTAWFVTAADEYPGPVRNFLASFRPIG